MTTPPRLRALDQKDAADAAIGKAIGGTLAAAIWIVVLQPLLIQAGWSLGVEHAFHTDGISVYPDALGLSILVGVFRSAIHRP
jgi:hypothetical protein